MRAERGHSTCLLFYDCYDLGVLLFLFFFFLVSWKTSLGVCLDGFAVIPALHLVGRLALGWNWDWIVRHLALTGV